MPEWILEASMAVVVLYLARCATWSAAMINGYQAHTLPAALLWASNKSSEKLCRLRFQKLRRIAYRSIYGV